MLNKIETSKKIPEIFSFETLLCIFVIFIHTSSEAIDNFDSVPTLATVLFVLWKLVSFVVPAFIFLSGLKLSKKYAEEKVSYFRFLSRRITKIYFPYLLWVVIYYCYFCFFTSIAEFSSFSYTDLLWHAINPDFVAHFYFISVIMQFYLLFPALLFVIKRSTPWIVILISLIITIVFKANINPMVRSLSYGYIDRAFTTYFVFFICGCYAGIYYKNFTFWLKIFRSLLSKLYFVIAAAHVVLSTLEYLGKYKYVYSDGVYIVFCVISTVVFYNFCMKLNLYSIKINESFKGLASLAFYVYLSHILVIFITENLLNINNITDIGQRFALVTVAACLISPVGAFLYVKLKNSIRR